MDAKASQIYFDTVVLPLRDRMFRLCLSMLGNRAEAEDTVQDTLEKLWVMRAKLQRYDSIEAFTYSVVRNGCLDRLRRRSRRDFKNIAVEEVTNLQSPAGTTVETTELSGIVASLMARLPEKQQLVIHLREVEGNSFAEIAQTLGIDETAVRMNLSRGRKTLKEKLEKIMQYGI